ncbi:sensor histidine kinase [Corynebacterium sp. AOP40-9SA-29]|uniref:sensor histidine kinase n=1 Tax=Corynebacterium sp. AOP40-9SA-29 TaxID=3457677 RepID=UPI00403365B1
MNPTVLESVTRPRRTWRGLGAGAKLAVYTRLSMQLMVAAFGAFAVLFPLAVAGQGSALNLWQQALVAGSGLALTVVALVVVERRPEFNTRPRRPTGRLVAVTGAATAVVWTLGVLLYVAGSSATAVTGLGLVVIAILVAPTAVLPWLPWRWTLILVFSAATSVLMWDELEWVPLFFGTFLMTTVVASAWTVNIAKQLDRARLTDAALQVSEERLRFSQELHDTLGQRLAAMSLKAELARALVARGDERADSELGQLQELARTSVIEMHEVVDGYRAVNLSTEVDGARQLLHSAGVHLDVDGDPTALSEPMRELAAWLVREGTTNVVRHSAATRVRLAFTSGADEAVTMSNDGVTRGIERLSGLAGIRRRAEPLGAELVAERDGTVFRVTLRLPGQ